MKSSLKFTTIALLLGGVLNVSNLDAAAAATADASSSASGIVALDNAIGGGTLQRSAFFKQPFAGDKGEVLILLADSAGESAVAKQKRSFAGEAIAKGWLSEELIRSKVAGAGGTKKILEGWANVACGVALARVSNPSLFAFSEPLVPSAVVPVSTGWTAYLTVNPADSALPIAEQLYLLKVRSQLESPVGLTAALTQLDELLGLVQSITLRNRGDENLVRAGFLVNAIPQVRGIAPIIGGYLQSILAQIKYIDDHKDAVSVSPAGYFSRSVEVKKYSDLQNLQLRELRAREELAYAAFDAIFGRMAKPASVPAPALFTADYSPANEFAHKLHNLHATLPATRVSEKLIVKDDGSIAVIGSSDFITGIDLRSEFMTQACTATTAFKAKALGATKLVKDTFRSSALAGFADLVPAKASLTPAPVDLASASGDASAVSVTATVTTD